MNGELAKKEKQAIELLKMFTPEDEPYYLCYSGGKDSDCIRILAHLAGIPHEIHHNVTSVDAPETMRYIKTVPGVSIDVPCDRNGNRLTMWNLIVKKKMPPTRLVRYCCSALKENGGKCRLKITGVRAAESRNRAENGGFVKIIGKPVTVQKKAQELGADYSISPKGGIVLNMDNDPSRRLVEHCFRTTTTMVNPILNWADDDVWEFLHHYGCDSNPLYQCGFKRIGCIGCPMAGKHRYAEFARYPKYKNLYIRAFDRMLAAGLESNAQWRTGLDVFRWWMGEDPAQPSIFEEDIYGK